MWCIYIDPYEDQFEKRSEKRKEAIAKNEYQRLRNISRSIKGSKVKGKVKQLTKNQGGILHGGIFILSPPPNLCSPSATT